MTMLFQSMLANPWLAFRIRGVNNNLSQTNFQTVVLQSPKYLQHVRHLHDSMKYLCYFLKLTLTNKDRKMDG